MVDLPLPSHSSRIWGMLLVHEHPDPRPCRLGLGRGHHCFYAASPSNGNAASKPDHHFEENVVTFAEDVDSDDPHNQDAYNPGTAGVQTENDDSY